VTTTNGLMAYFGNIEKVYSSDRVPVGIRREVAMRITRQAGITDIDKSRFKEGGKRGRGDMSGGDSDNKQSSGKQQQTAGGGKQPVLSTDPERIKALLGAAAASIGQQG
jgi:hypothetical protein